MTERIPNGRVKGQKIKTKLLKLKKKLFEKDINAVTHPIMAPINRDNVNIPKKSPTDLKKARVSNSPPLE